MGAIRDRRRWPAIGPQWLLTGRGPGRHEHLEAGGLLRTHAGVTYPDLLLGFAPVAMRFDRTSPTAGYQLIMAACGPRPAAP